jgi:hypothetical protein
VAAQDDLTFSTAVDLNYKQLTLTAVVGTITNEFKPEIWTLSVAPSLSWRGFFLSAAAERSLGEGSTSGPLSTPFWSDRRYKREENSVSLGYNVWAGLTVFAGYLNNSTETNFVNTTIGSAVPTSIGRIEYSEKGPYYGLGYAHRFAKGGTLGASLAVARADGKLDQISPSSISTPVTTAEGDVTGTSYGLSWSAPLAGDLYYRLGYKATRYDFKFVVNGIERNTKQNYDTIFLGVVKYF